MRLRFALAIISFLSTATMAQVRYFPTGSLSSKQRSGEFRAKWYSEQLKLSKNLRWGSPQRRKKLNRIGFFGCERSKENLEWYWWICAGQPDRERHDGFDQGTD